MQAKFVVKAVTLMQGAELLLMEPVMSGPGNEEWSNYTPSGKLEMTVTNPALHGTVKPGMVYLVDFVIDAVPVLPGT